MEQATTIDPSNQQHWWAIVTECAYSIDAICADHGFSRKSFVKWLRNDRTPRKSNFEKLVQLMGSLTETRKRERHPAFGYATKEQIDLVNSMGIGPKRDSILQQIEVQNKLGGKIR